MARAETRQAGASRVSAAGPKYLQEIVSIGAASSVGSTAQTKVAS